MNSLPLLLLVILLVVFGPLVTIWALNVLFPVLAIPYNIETWFASIILAGVFKTTVDRA